jgi:hypothetical protein
MNLLRLSPSPRFRVIAIIAAYNEGDVIYHVIRDLIENDVEVYLVDNCSTDNTAAEASRWLGKGLLNIERFPDDAGGSQRSCREYAWGDLLRRKEELATELDASWFIHADGDEFRESLWPDMRLADGIRLVDQLGYNAIQFEVLNFRPVDDRFVPGDDVRDTLTAYEPPDSFDVLQVKAWKKCGQRPDLAQTAGHDVQFADRRVFPFRFPLRHYPIRSTQHGMNKVFRDRLPRFMPEERAVGWHVQYDKFRDGGEFLRNAKGLREYDVLQVREEIAARTHATLNGTRPTPTRDSQAHAIAVPAAAALNADALIRQLHDSAAFVKFYNLASQLQCSGAKEVAAEIFDSLVELLRTLNPELAGKASYKLALLSDDSGRQVACLHNCLKLCPDHKAARKKLTEFSSC